MKSRAVKINRAKVILLKVILLKVILLKVILLKVILLALAISLLVSGSNHFACARVEARTPSQEQGQSQQSSSNGSQPSNSGKEYLGPTADSIRPYRPANRDPFKRFVKPSENKKQKEQKPRTLGFPALDVRRAEFRQKVEIARQRDMTEPDPVLQYLVSELDITGVFRDERGLGAFVRAQPTGTVFFIRRGARCYNGEVMNIESDESDTKVLFREYFYLEVNGKQTQQERMVAKLPGLPANNKK
jgi:hypothetical protein